ncbi:DUF6371 domain-containing protein [Pontibacter sp. H259]|uniref:DUF6371 domain-containing protein n=1 Tax=Pontibacter sp. H259 TaxID=3133421 RepID=UPI0030C465EA
MAHYRYTLPSYRVHRTRFTCPACGEKKRFNRYIDTETNTYLHESVGRCDREIKCGCHKTPRQFFAETQGTHTGSLSVPYHSLSRTIEPPQAPSYVPENLFQESLHTSKPNHFLTYLIRLFGRERARALSRQYHIGFSDHWAGATVFWQQDKEGNIRSGKIMLYDPTTGKRVKHPYNYINWVHNTEKLQGFNLQQCLYGEHLLRAEPLKPVAVVESEKTAVIASVYLPQFVWVAVGSLSNLNVQRCQALQGRQVVLFPDIGGFERWRKKAQDLAAIATVKVSDLLERSAGANGKEDGWDLADYLVKFGWKEFRPK